MPVLDTLCKVLIFPGCLFCFVAGLLLNGVDRKLTARMQGRVGPPVTQPFYDFFKLMGKETIVPGAAARKTFLLAPVLGLASLAVTALFLPIGGKSAVSGVGDMVVVAYLLTLPAVALILGGAASGSPYAGVGVSREMVAVMSYELPFMMVLLCAGRAAAGTGGVTFSLAEIARYQMVKGCLLFRPAMIPAALAMLLVIPCEVGSRPFDIAEAETEICEGPLVEYSGAPLALFKLSGGVRQLIMSALFFVLFLGGVSTGNPLLDPLLLLGICMAVTVLSTTLLRAVSARLKVEQVFKFYWTAVAGLAGVSLGLVWLGL